MFNRLLLESKGKRVLLALGLALAPLVLIVIIGMGFDIIDEGIDVIGVGGLCAAAVGILDFFLYLMLDTDREPGRFGLFLKNAIFYIIMIVEFILAFVSIGTHSFGESDKLANLETYGGVGGMAFFGLVTFSWLIKFFTYLKIGNGKFLPQEGLPYVSVGSMIVGYLIALIFMLIGLTSDFVIQWVPFIVFMVCSVLLIVHVFKNGAIFDDYSPYSSGYSGGYSSSKPSKKTSSGKKTAKGNSTAKSGGSDEKDYTKAGVWLEISRLIEGYCDKINKRRYPGGDYISYADLHISSRLDGKKYVVEWDIEVIFFYNSQGENHHAALKCDAQAFLSKIASESQTHMEKMMEILEKTLLEKDPSYPGEYGVHAPEITGDFEKAY